MTNVKVTFAFSDSNTSHEDIATWYTDFNQAVEAGTKTYIWTRYKIKTGYYYGVALYDAPEGTGSGETVDLSNYYGKQEADNRTRQLIKDNVRISYKFGTSATTQPSINSYYDSFSQALANREGDYLWIETKICNAYECFPILYEAPSGGSADLTGYATETYVQQQIAAIEHPTTDLTGYALKSEIPSLDGYAKTTDIPDVSAFRTEEQIIALIQQYGGGSGENLPASEEVEF
jgi:hypothetical protein